MLCVSLVDCRKYSTVITIKDITPYGLVFNNYNYNNYYHYLFIFINERNISCQGDEHHVTLKLDASKHHHHLDCHHRSLVPHICDWLLSSSFPHNPNKIQSLSSFLATTLRSLLGDPLWFFNILYRVGDSHLLYILSKPS